MARVELRDGQWAELRESITHGDDKRIRALWRRAKSDDDDAWLDLNTLVVRVYVRAWYVNDPDGVPIPITDADAIERAPDDIVDVLVSECSKLWKAYTRTDPTPPSSDASS